MPAPQERSRLAPLTMEEREAREARASERNARMLIKGGQGVLDLIRDRIHAGGHGALRKFFTQFDKNHDGKIEYDEFAKVTRESFHGDVLTDEQMRELFKVLDVKGNGCVMYDELNVVLNVKPKAFLGTPTLGEKPKRYNGQPHLDFDAGSSLIAEKLAAKREPNKLRQLFQELDQNGDGVLSRAALHRAALIVQPAATEGELDRFADAMGEKDGEGVDYNRFLRVMQGIQMGHEGRIGNGPAEEQRPSLAQRPGPGGAAGPRPRRAGGAPSTPLFQPTQESIHRYGNIRNMINGTYGELPSRLGNTPAPPDTMAWFKPPPGAPASDSAPRADADIEALRKQQAANRGALRHKHESVIVQMRAAHAQALADKLDAKLFNMNDRKDAMQERYINPSNDSIRRKVGVRPFLAENKAMFQVSKHIKSLGVM